jgi:small subunit ribosomal protein S17
MNETSNPTSVEPGVHDAGHASASAKATKRSLVGRVVSAKMKQTVTVLVERQVQHPLYGKYMTRSNKYHAHDESDAIREGDTVEIVEVRPISRTKTWRVVRVVEAAQVI